MPIIFDCPACSHRLRVPDEAAGRKGKCPGCGEKVAIPLESEVSSFRDTIPLADLSEPVGVRVAVPDAADVDTNGGPSPAMAIAPATVAVARPSAPQPAPAGNPAGKHMDRDPAAAEPLRVVVVDFKMTFDSMVVFMVKWALAAIPAFLILALTGALLGGILMLIVGAVLGRFGGP